MPKRECVASCRSRSDDFFNSSYTPTGFRRLPRQAKRRGVLIGAPVQCPALRAGYRLPHHNSILPPAPVWPALGYGQSRCWPIAAAF